MGKGDKKTRRGKIIIGTFGVRRPKHKTNKNHVSKKEEIVLKAESAEKKAKIAAPSKTEMLVKIEPTAKALVKKTTEVETKVVKTAPADKKVETKKTTESKTAKKPVASKTSTKKKASPTKDPKKPKEDE